MMEAQHIDIVSRRAPILATLTRDKLGYSLAEAEVVSGWSRASLYRAVAAGKLKMTGRSILREDLEHFLRSERDLLR